MAQATTSGWNGSGALMLAMLAGLAVVIEAMPLGLEPNARPSPDLLFCIVAFWALRRPEATPILLVATLGLFRDLLTDVPVGAGALTLVLAAEVLKRRAPNLQRGSVISEWLLVAGAAATILIVLWLVVLLTLLKPPYLLILGQQWLITVLVYVPLALTLRALMRIRTRPDAGHRRAKA